MRLFMSAAAPAAGQHQECFITLLRRASAAKRAHRAVSRLTQRQG